LFHQHALVYQPQLYWDLNQFLSIFSPIQYSASLPCSNYEVFDNRKKFLVPFYLPSEKLCPKKHVCAKFNKIIGALKN